MKVLLSILLTFTATVVLAQTGANSRFAPFKQKAIQEIEAMSAEKTVRVQYDFGLHGGAVGTIGLGKYLPAGAIITRSFLYIDTQLASGGTGTIALKCEDANNIKTATYLGGSSSGDLVEGASTGATSAMVKSIAARCEISAVLAVSDFTAGKLTAWVKYVLHD
jgi:hypothetical protein